jgi:hypothetical protein
MVGTTTWGKAQVGRRRVTTRDKLNSEKQFAVRSDWRRGEVSRRSSVLVVGRLAVAEGPNFLLRRRAALTRTPRRQNKAVRLTQNTWDPFRPD